jgi:hypothetical protein
VSIIIIIICTNAKETKKAMNGEMRKNQMNYANDHDDECSMDPSTSLLSIDNRDNRVAVEETTSVKRSRVLVFFVLLIAISGAVSVYIYNDRTEEKNFKQNFQADAFKVRYHVIHLKEGK